MFSKLTEVTLVDGDESVLKIREFPDNPSVVLICNECDELFWFDKKDKQFLIDAINAVCNPTKRIKMCES